MIAVPFSTHENNPQYPHRSKLEAVFSLQWGRGQKRRAMRLLWEDLVEIFCYAEPSIFVFVFDLTYPWVLEISLARKLAPGGMLSLSPVCCPITRVLSYHTCVILSHVCYLITRVLFYHPCVILSPACYLITRVFSLSPVCYTITLVLFYHPCVILSHVCYLITRVLFYHPCVILSRVCYLITSALS